MIYTAEEAQRIIGVHNRLHGGNAKERKQAKKLGIRTSESNAAPAIEVKQDLRNIEKLLEAK
jgi:hypothetical protein